MQNLVKKTLAHMEANSGHTRDGLLLHLFHQFSRSVEEEHENRQCRTKQDGHLRRRYVVFIIIVYLELSGDSSERCDSLNHCVDSLSIVV